MDEDTRRDAGPRHAEDHEGRSLMDWFGVKQWLSVGTGLGMDALHVHAGVLLQVAAALVLRRRLSSPLPWLLLLLFVLANEFYDYGYEIWRDRAAQRAEALRDSWNTMLLPTLILLLARYAPQLFVGRPAPAAEAPSADPGEPRR